MSPPPNVADEEDQQWVHETDQAEQLADGFIDHGAVGFRVNTRGWVSTHNGEGEDVVLAWLKDANAGWLGMINVDTGTYEEFRPAGRSVAAPFASLLSSRNRFYACNHHFVEFDPERPGFSFVAEDVDDGDSLAMSLTEDDEGVIWAATYPDATVVRFDPATAELVEFGPVYDHPSSMYPRSIAADDHGWVYIGLNPAAGQLLILDRDTGETRPVLAADETESDGPVEVTRDVDGSVYGRAGDRWFELRDGTATALAAPPDVDPVDIVAGAQSLRHRELPSGRRVTEFAVGEPDPYLAVADPTTDETVRVPFAPSGGDVIPMRLTAAPDGSIVGGTSLPVQLFRYRPDADEWNKTNNVGQWNVITPAADAVYVGQYPDGALLRWDPTAPWRPPAGDERDLDANPAYLANDRHHVHRPFTVLVHPNGRDVILGGQPDYGHTGGGLLFWDREAATAEVLGHEQLLEHHITRTLVALPDGSLFGGTDTRPAGGGVRKADVARLYHMDLDSRAITWSGAPLADVDRYQDLVVTDDGIVLGIADRDRLFAFDPERRELVHEAVLDEETVDHQSPHILVQGPDGRVFLLFASGTIADVAPDTYEVTTLARCPAGIRNGGAVSDDRLWLCTDTQVFSWSLPAAE